MPGFRSILPLIFNRFAAQLSAVLVAGLLLSPAASAQWFGSATIEALGSDNVSRAPLEIYAEEDQSLQASASGGYHWQIADYTGLELQGSLQRQQSLRFASLSNTRLAASAVLSHKFGLGERAPTLSLTSAIERSSYNNSLRNASTWTGSLNYRQRLTDRLSIGLGAGYEQQDGDHSQPKPAVPPALPLPGDVWDTDAVTLNANAELDLDAASWLSASLGYRTGDTVASTQPRPFILAESTAVVFDSAFAPGFVAYRLDTRSRAIALDWNRALSDSATLYVGIERQFTHSDRGLSYRTNFVRTGLIYSF